MPSRSKAAAPAPAREAAGRWTTLDLSAHHDNDGISFASAPGDGAFNIWGNTFPAESLPEGGRTCRVGGVPFAFPDTADGAANNLRCRGQRIEVPEGRYGWIHVLAAAERRTEDEVELEHPGGVGTRAWLRVSDFWPETEAWFGEALAFRCRAMHYPRHVQANMRPSVWHQRVPVAVRLPLLAVRLPDNPALHVFAMTLARDGEAPAWDAR
jgi:hypothetical protein